MHGQSTIAAVLLILVGIAIVGMIRTGSNNVIAENKTSSLKGQLPTLKGLIARFLLERFQHLVDGRVCRNRDSGFTRQAHDGAVL